MRHQKGAVLIVSLVIILCATLLGLSAVTSSLRQSKMSLAVQQQRAAFNAAESAIAGVVFEAEDPVLLRDPDITDALTLSRQGNVFNPRADTLVCGDSTTWTNRSISEATLSRGNVHTGSGYYRATPNVSGWSRTAFVREQACKGSSKVVGSGGLKCHVFAIRGCGQIANKSTITANTVTIAVFGPATE